MCSTTQPQPLVASLCHYRFSISKFLYSLYNRIYQVYVFYFNVFLFIIILWKTFKMLLVYQHFATLHLLYECISIQILMKILDVSSFLDNKNEIAMTNLITSFLWSMYFYIVGHILSIIFLTFMRNYQTFSRMVWIYQQTTEVEDRVCGLENESLAFKWNYKSKARKHSKKNERKVKRPW